MAELKILIVEDEMIIAAKISLHLTQLGYEVSGIIPRGEEVILHCQQSPPDLLLLDINLKGSIDGIETATQLQAANIDIPIIYLTANADETTFDRAKHTRPHAFISKPYKKLDLQRAIELAIGRMANSTESPPPIVEKTTTPPTEDAHYILSDRIFVRHKNRMVKLFLDDILYIEAERSYCRIQTKDTEYLLSMPLRVFAEKLDGGQFFRIHRSYIVSLPQIDEVGETHIIVSKKLIPIGKSYKEAFSQRIRMI